MDRLIAYCGLDCGDCPAYAVTQARDVAGQQRLVEQWRVEFGMPDMPLEAVLCDGCSPSRERHGSYCAACEVRACGEAHNVPNCAYCSDYACSRLDAMFARNPELREAMDALHTWLAV